MYKSITINKTPGSHEQTSLLLVFDMHQCSTSKAKQMTWLYFNICYWMIPFGTQAIDLMHTAGASVCVCVCQHLTHLHRFPCLISGTVMHVGSSRWRLTGQIKSLTSIHSSKSPPTTCSNSPGRNCDERLLDTAYINPDSVLSLL